MTDPTPGPEGQPQDPHGPPPTHPYGVSPTPPPPTNPYGEPPANPYGAPPAENPYGAPPTSEPTYGQPPTWGGEPGAQPYGTQPYGAQPYGGYAQPGYPAAPYGYAPPRDHPKATHALVWGLVSLIGGFLCALPLLVSPVAWVVGVRARREIDAQPGLGGRGQATAGMVMGIIGTVLLALGIAFVVLIIVLALSSAGGSVGTVPGGTDF